MFSLCWLTAGTVGAQIVVFLLSEVGFRDLQLGSDFTGIVQVSETGCCLSPKTCLASC